MSVVRTSFGWASRDMLKRFSQQRAADAWADRVFQDDLSERLSTHDRLFFGPSAARKAAHYRGPRR